MSIFKNKIFIGITKVCIMVSLSSCSYEGYSSSDSYFKRSGYSYYPAYIDTESNNTFRSANNVRNIPNVPNANGLTIFAGNNNTRVVSNNAPRAIPIWGEYTGNDLARDLGIPKPVSWDDPNVIEVWDPNTKQLHGINMDVYTGNDLHRDIKTGVVKRQYTGNDLANDIGIKSIGNIVQGVGIKDTNPNPIADKGLTDIVNHGGAAQDLTETVSGNDATPQDLTQTVSDSANNDTASADNSSGNDTSADNSGSDNSSVDSAGADNSGSDNSSADNANADNSGSDNSSTDTSSADTSSSDNSSADAAASADKANESEAKAE